MIIVDILAI